MTNRRRDLVVGCHLEAAGPGFLSIDRVVVGRAATRRMTLGRVDALPYAKARKAAEALYHRTRLGEDPAGARDGERAAPTLDTIITRYMAEEISPARKPRTVALYAQYFRNHVSPALGRKRASEITHSDVAKLHRAIGAAGARVTANRVSFADQFVVHLGRKSRRGPARHQPSSGRQPFPRTGTHPLFIQ